MPSWIGLPHQILQTQISICTRKMYYHCICNLIAHFVVYLQMLILHSSNVRYFSSFECKFVRRIQIPPLCWNSCQKRTNFASFWPFFVPRLWRMMSRLVFESYLYTTVFGYALVFFSISFVVPISQCDKIISKGSYNSLEIKTFGLGSRTRDVCS